MNQDTAIGVDIREARRIVDALKPLAREVVRRYRRMAWALTHKPITDTERFALNLARRHVREGRTDLAAEDFAWLGARLEASAVAEGLGERWTA